MPARRSAAPTAVRFSLENGLSVILAPEPASPTASVWVWYRVGSRNEWPGITGASHWVEHMLFEGSPKYPKGAIDRAVLEAGGTLNAFTDCDFTAYFTTVPREKLEIPLAIEADRMTRALLEPAEVERERTIIRSEREGNENWPEFRVDEETYALAFRQHPYRWDPLGYPEDIRRISPSELSEYYHRFYGTRNAVLIVAGGFDAAGVEADVRNRFGPLPETGAPPEVGIREPPPVGERRGELHGPGTTPLLELAWRAPAVREKVAAAMMILDVVLGGETRMFSASAAGGRSSEHPSARLYRRLVEPGLAIRATSEWRARLDPGLFHIHVQAAPGVGLDRLEAAALAEVDRLSDSGPTGTEIADAKVKVARGAALSYEGATRTAARLGHLALLGPVGLEGRWLRELGRVTTADVREQARAVFRSSGRIVVRYTPEAPGAAS